MAAIDGEGIGVLRSSKIKSLARRAALLGSEPSKSSPRKSSTRLQSAGGRSVRSFGMMVPDGACRLDAV